MEGTSHPGDTQNRCRLASCRFSAVLEMAFKSPVEGRSQAGEQTDSSLNFSNGCGKSNLGSTTHSWRVAQARLRSIGTNGFALGAASPKTSRSRQALADFPEEPSRGDRSDGLLHGADPDLRHSVLLLRDRPRPASDPALQRDSQSQRALGCPAVARDLGIQPTAAALPDLRSGRQVQCRCGLDREGDGQPTDSHRIPKSLAERHCRALGWQCTSRSPGPCDRAESQTSATAAERVRPLLPRGPDSSRTWEGHSWWSSCSVTAVEWPQGYLSAATRWSASPLRSRGLTISSSKLTSARIGGRFTPGSWQTSSLSRFRDAQSGSKTTPYKALLSKKRPPASKLGGV